MSRNFSRRQFLSGDFRKYEVPVRPPGASGEAGFLNACTQCSVCIDTCPENIITKDPLGYPQLDFNRGGCTFCQECSAVCKEDALQTFRDGTLPWVTTAVITGHCLSHHRVDCRVCEDACETRAIRFESRAGGLSQPSINMSCCTGCGSCVAVCPARAIQVTNRPPLHEEKPCPSSTSVAY